jgi:hypothetical protein
MGVPSSEVCYILTTTRRGDHELHKGHVVALAKKRGGGGGIDLKTTDGLWKILLSYRVKGKESFMFYTGLQIISICNTSQC